MSLKKKLHPLAHKPFVGSVELIPPQPLLVEFIDAHRIWGFPIHQLTRFLLEENQEHHGKQILPPHILLLVYPGALVALRGWRLELMIGPLVSGRVARVHAEKLLGPLIIDEAWVSEIRVIPFGRPSVAKDKQEEPKKARP